MKRPLSIDCGPRCLKDIPEHDYCNDRYAQRNNLDETFQ